MVILLGGFLRQEQGAIIKAVLIKWTLSPVDLDRRWSKIARTLFHYRTQRAEKTVKLPLKLLEFFFWNHKSSYQKLSELKEDFITQILDSINSAINEKIRPAIQNTIGRQMTVFEENLDHRSSRLIGTTEVKHPRKTWGIHPDLDKNLSNHCNLTREDSIDSQRREANYDTHLI